LLGQRPLFLLRWKLRLALPSQGLTLIQAGRSMEPQQDLILVIDAGTTGIRAALVNKELQCVQSIYEAIDEKYISHPNPGWITMDPEGLWATTKDVTTKCIATVGVHRIRALAVTTQRASVIMIDDKGEPVSPFIPWQDARTGALCDEMNESASLSVIRGGASLAHFLSRSPKFKAGSVWTFGPMMACTKVAWLLQNDANLVKLLSEGRLRYGHLDTWLMFRLSGGAYWGTDRSNLNAGGFFDPWTDGPNNLVYQLLKIPPSLSTPCEKPSRCGAKCLLCGAFLEWVDATVFFWSGSSHAFAPRSGLWGTTPKSMFFDTELPIMTVVSDQGEPAVSSRERKERRLTGGDKARRTWASVASRKERPRSPWDLVRS
jgi:glycerol kinase